MSSEQEVLEMKAERIFSSDKSIRFVVLLTSDGRPIGEIGRSGVTSLEPSNETETVYVKATIAMNMSAPMDKYFGRIRTVILIREKVTIICFNLSSRIMLISANPDFQLDTVEQLGQLVDELNIS